MLSRHARYALPHYCFIHPRDKFRSFKLSEGRLLRGSRFICHDCIKRVGQEVVRLGSLSKDSPLEKKIRQFLEKRHAKFIENYRIGKFKFDFALPHLRLLIEADGRIYHKAEKPTEDGLPKPLTVGTREWVVHHNDWKLIRIRNGPDFEKRMGREIEKSLTGS